MKITTKSEQITEGLRKSFQTVDCKMANRPCYGYTVHADGELIVNESEAAVVRWIFDRYLAGDSLGKIAAGLESRESLLLLARSSGIVKPSPSSCPMRSTPALCCCKKTVSICGMQFQNNGELGKVLVKNHHDAIISTADFEKVQQMKQERSKAPTQECEMKLSIG